MSAASSGGGSGSGKKGLGGVDRSGQDRTKAEKILYDSDDEDQAGRRDALQVELARRMADPKLGAPKPPGTKPSDWRNDFNHRRQIRTVKESLASATSRAAGGGGVPHSEEFTALRDSRAGDDGAELALRAQRTRMEGSHRSSSPPPEAVVPGLPAAGAFGGAPLMSASAAAASAPSFRSPSPVLAPAPAPALRSRSPSPEVRGGSHAAPPSPRKPPPKDDDKK